MQCPIDGAKLVMTERAGVEIDYCPHCRGVWLDRGELDKIIERSAEVAPQPVRLREPERDSYRERGRDEAYERSQERRSEKPYKRKKTKSFLSEIFDFD